MTGNDLKAVIGSNESILWEGIPDKKCFILESIFNPLLPFAVIWAAVDIFAIGSFVGDSGAAGFLLPFFALHLMPVWLYLGGVLLALRRYRNTHYIITDAGVYVSGGTFSYSYQMKPFTELTSITMHRGIFDQYIGVGDIVFGLSPEFSDVSYGNRGRSIRTGGLSIINIRDYQEIYKLVKELQKNVYADTMYPNDLRPETNHGYNTKLVNK